MKTKTYGRTSTASMLKGVAGQSANCKFNIQCSQFLFYFEQKKERKVEAGS